MLSALRRAMHHRRKLCGHLSLPFVGLSLPFLGLSLAFIEGFHCLSCAFHCLSLAFHCLSLAFHCLRYGHTIADTEAVFAAMDTDGSGALDAEVRQTRGFER